MAAHCRSARLRWFQRSSDGEGEMACGPEVEKSVNQAFRRCNTHPTIPDLAHISEGVGVESVTGVVGE